MLAPSVVNLTKSIKKYFDLLIARLQPSEWLPIQGPVEDWLRFCLASFAHNLEIENKVLNAFRFDDLRRTSYWAWADRLAVVIANWSRRAREAGGKARERLETPLAVVTLEARLYSG